MKTKSFINYRSQIESGILRVVTDLGEPVEIVKWNCRGKYPILAVISSGDTDDSCFYSEEGISFHGSDKLCVIKNKEGITLKHHNK